MPSFNSAWWEKYINRVRFSMWEQAGMPRGEDDQHRAAQELARLLHIDHMPGAGDWVDVDQVWGWYKRYVLDLVRGSDSGSVRAAQRAADLAAAIARGKRPKIARGPLPSTKEAIRHGGTAGQVYRNLMNRPLTQSSFGNTSKLVETFAPGNRPNTEAGDVLQSRYELLDDFLESNRLSRIMDRLERQGRITDDPIGIFNESRFVRHLSYEDITSNIWRISASVGTGMDDRDTLENKILGARRKEAFFHDNPKFRAHALWVTRREERRIDAEIRRITPEYQTLANDVIPDVERQMIEHITQHGGRIGDTAWEYLRTSRAPLNKRRGELYSQLYKLNQSARAINYTYEQIEGLEQPRTTPDVFQLAAQIIDRRREPSELERVIARVSSGGYTAHDLDSLFKMWALGAMPIGLQESPVTGYLSVPVRSGKFAGHIVDLLGLENRAKYDYRIEPDGSITRARPGDFTRGVRAIPSNIVPAKELQNLSFRFGEAPVSQPILRAFGKGLDYRFLSQRELKLGVKNDFLRSGYIQRAVDTVNQSWSEIISSRIASAGLTDESTTANSVAGQIFAEALGGRAATPQALAEEIVAGSFSQGVRGIRGLSKEELIDLAIKNRKLDPEHLPAFIGRKALLRMLDDPRYTFRGKPYLDAINELLKSKDSPFSAETLRLLSAVQENIGSKRPYTSGFWSDFKSSVINIDPRFKPAMRAETLGNAVDRYRRQGMQLRDLESELQAQGELMEMPGSPIVRLATHEENVALIENELDRPIYQQVRVAVNKRVQMIIERERAADSGNLGRVRQIQNELDDQIRALQQRPAMGKFIANVEHMTNVIAGPLVDAERTIAYNPGAVSQIAAIRNWAAMISGNTNPSGVSTNTLAAAIAAAKSPDTIADPITRAQAMDRVARGFRGHTGVAAFQQVVGNTGLTGQPFLDDDFIRGTTRRYQRILLETGEGRAIFARQEADPVTKAIGYTFGRHKEVGDQLIATISKAAKWTPFQTDVFRQAAFGLGSNPFLGNSPKEAALNLFNLIGSPVDVNFNDTPGHIGMFARHWADITRKPISQAPRGIQMKLVDVYGLPENLGEPANYSKIALTYEAMSNMGAEERAQVHAAMNMSRYMDMWREAGGASALFANGDTTSYRVSFFGAQAALAHARLELSDTVRGPLMYTQQFNWSDLFNKGVKITNRDHKEIEAVLRNLPEDVLQGLAEGYGVSGWTKAKDIRNLAEHLAGSINAGYGGVGAFSPVANSLLFNAIEGGPEYPSRLMPDFEHIINMNKYYSGTKNTVTYERNLRGQAILDQVFRWKVDPDVIGRGKPYGWRARVGLFDPLHAPVTATGEKLVDAWDYSRTILNRQLKERGYTLEQIERIDKAFGPSTMINLTDGEYSILHAARLRLGYGDNDRYNFMYSPLARGGFLRGPGERPENYGVRSFDLLGEIHRPELFTYGQLKKMAEEQQIDVSAYAGRETIGKRNALLQEMSNRDMPMQSDRPAGDLAERLIERVHALYSPEVQAILPEDMRASLERARPGMPEEIAPTAEQIARGAEEAFQAERVVLNRGTYKRIGDSWKEAWAAHKESSFVKLGGGVIAATLALGLIRTIRPKDHTPEDVMPAANMPNTSYAQNNMRTLYSPSGYQGVTYRVNAVGSYDPTSLQNAMVKATGARVTGSYYKAQQRPGTQEQDMNQIMADYK